MRKRDAGPQIFYRFERLERSKVEDGKISLIGSTDNAVRFGSYREVLLHGAENVDPSACKALLINHDPNRIAGPIREIGFDGKRSLVKAEINAKAVMDSGVPVRDAVDDGSLSGVSIGYGYDPESADDCDFDEATRTVTVKRWRLMEITLTPIPRDTDAMVRAFDSAFTKRRSAAVTPKQEMTMDPKKLAALLRAHPTHAELIGSRIEAGVTDVAVIEADIVRAEDAAKRAKDQGDERSRAAAIESERNALLLEKQIRSLAESHHLVPSEYEKEKTFDAALTRMMADKAKTAEGAQGPVRIVPTVTMTADADDKFRDAAIDGMLARGGLTVRKEGFKDQVPYEVANKDLGMRGSINFHNLIRKCGMRAGEPNAWEWSKDQCYAWFRSSPILGMPAMRDSKMFRSANQAYGQFSYILANVMDKAVALGFQGFEAITYDQWCRPRQVDDFKPFSSAALAIGNLQSTVEGVALPELTVKDTGYNSQLGITGGTLTMTMQAMFSDDLGEFMRVLGQTGMVARRTIDRQVYITLIGGPTGGWSALNNYDNFTGIALATQGSLDVARNGFRKKINQVGQLMGNAPYRLLHPIPLSQAADRATGRAQPPGEQSYLASNEARSLKILEVNYLDDPTITGYSTSNYFLVGTPDVDSMVVATLTGMQVPQVMEFDPGATVDRKFKVIMPFVVVLPTYTDSNGIANRPIGLTRGTA